MENWVVGSPESSASGSKASGAHPSSRSVDVAKFEEGNLQGGSSFNIVSTSRVGTGGFSPGASTPSGVLPPLASPHASQQAHYSTNPQASEGPPGFSSRMSSAPQEESYNQVAAFSLVHRGEYLGPGDVPSSLHSVRFIVSFPASSFIIYFGNWLIGSFRSARHYRVFVYHLDRRPRQRYHRHIP